MSRLDEIRGRLAKATPGPWRWQWSGYEVADGITDKPVEFDNLSFGEARGAILWGPAGSHPLEPRLGALIVEAEDLETEGRAENADFIAHAPEDIAYLLSLLGEPT